MFVLHEQLAKDTVLLGALPLNMVLLMDNALYPWLILVPQQENTKEIWDIAAEKRNQLWEEVTAVADMFQQFFNADKINVASLGNVVSQLHVHIVARFTSDKSWPDPVWGKDKPRLYYTEEQKEIFIPNLLSSFKQLAGFAPASF